MCGLVHSDDYIIMGKGTVGRVVLFWGNAENYTVEFNTCTRIENHIFDMTDPKLMRVPISEVVDVLTWVEWGFGRIRVLPPFEFQDMSFLETEDGPGAD